MTLATQAAPPRPGRPRGMALSTPLRARILELLEQGARPSRVADQLGCSPGSVYLVRLAAGLVQPRATPADDFTTIDGKPVRRFTGTEDAALRRMDASGLTSGEMARAMARLFPRRLRDPSVILRRLKVLAVRPESAQ